MTLLLHSGHFRFYSSQLLVLLGRRPSISSIMRKKLLNPTLPTLQCIGFETTRRFHRGHQLLLS
jgi:hypothetical protein